MASGGEVGGALTDNIGSEDLEDIKCQPCQEDSEIREAVGVCTDCQEYLCQRCFDGHKIPKLTRGHQLLNKQEMMRSKQEKIQVIGSPVSDVSTIVKADHSHDINVKCADDKKDCRITGSVILPDNRLLIADCNNNKLKAVDVKPGQVSSQLTLSSNPWDIAVINNNQVAVTLPWAHKVDFVTTAGKLSVDRSLQLGDYCYGIDYRNDKLAVSFILADKICILDLQGTVLHSIKPVKQSTRLFYLPYYTSFGPDKTTLYVSNGGRNEALLIQFDGTIVTSYTDNDLKYPRGIALDRYGNVYVCAQSSHTIHQLTPDCKKIRVLLTEKDGLYKPRTVCYSKSDNKLYVGMNGYNSVKVYKATLGRD